MLLMFLTLSIYLDNLLNKDNPYSEKKVDQIYPTKLQCNEANNFDAEAPSLDLNLT